MPREIHVLDPQPQTLDQPQPTAIKQLRDQAIGPVQVIENAANLVVANAPLRVPADPLVELVVRAGFGAADDWIADCIKPGDVVVTADVPLAARCVARGARVLDPRGRVLTADNVGEALALRDLREGLRQVGEMTGGPAAMTPKDRSRFRSRLDELVHAARRAAGSP